MAMYVFAAFSALASLKSSQAQAEALRFQGEVALLQGEQQSLNYQREEINAKKQANAVLDKLMRANSAAVARAASMNLMPFEGSPLDLQKYNARQAGDEWSTAKQNAEWLQSSSDNALKMGRLQRDQNYAAADSTERIGWLKAIGSFGEAMYSGGKLGGTSPFSQAPAPVSTATIRYL